MAYLTSLQSGADLTAAIQVRDKAEVKYATVRDRIVQEDNKKREEHRRQILAAEKAKDTAESTSSTKRKREGEESKVSSTTEVNAHVNGTSSQQPAEQQNKSKSPSDQSQKEEVGKKNELIVSPELSQTIEAAEKAADDHGKRLLLASSQYKHTWSHDSLTSSWM